jgi:hypothetical protein
MLRTGLRPQVFLKILGSSDADPSISSTPNDGLTPHPI